MLLSVEDLHRIKQESRNEMYARLEAGKVYSTRSQTKLFLSFSYAYFVATIGEIFSGKKKISPDFSCRRNRNDNSRNCERVEYIATTALQENAVLVTNDGMAAVVQEICSKFRYEDWTK